MHQFSFQLGVYAAISLFTYITISSFEFTCWKKRLSPTAIFSLIVILSIVTQAAAAANEYGLRKVSNMKFDSGGSNSIDNPYFLGDRMIFTAKGENGIELFSTDGNTVTEYDIYPGENSSIPSPFYQWNNTLYFQARGPLGKELYSIGEEGTYSVMDLSLGTDGSWPNSFVEYSDYLYFRATIGNVTGLYRTDGNNIDFIHQFGTNIYNQPREINDKLVFLGSGSTGDELYVTDGNQVSLLADINPGPGNSSPYYFVEFDGSLYFPAVGENGTELFKTDGNSVEEFDINTGPSSSDPYLRFVFENHLYFQANTGNGTGFFKTDGSVVTEFDIYPGSNSSVSVVGSSGVSREYLYFVANGPNGNEIFQTDGEIVKEFDLNPGVEDSSPLFFNTVGEAIYFKAEGPQGKELYKALGDEVKLIDLNPGRPFSNPQTQDLVLYNESIYVTAVGSSGVALFIIEDDVPTEIDSLPGSRGSYPDHFFEFNGDLFFSAYSEFGRSVYRTDGDTIEELFNFPYSSLRGISEFVQFENSLLFIAQTQDGGRLYRISLIPEPSAMILFLLSFVVFQFRTNAIRT